MSLRKGTLIFVSLLVMVLALSLTSCVTPAAKFEAEKELEMKKMEYELNQYKFQMQECRKMCNGKVKSFSISTGDCECLRPFKKRSFYNRY